MRHPLLHADLEALAKIGRDPSGGNTRLAYSAADLEARRWLIGRLEANGLRARLDAAGNVIGRLEANVADADRRAVMVGSHLDTVPNGGPLDGALGVLAGIEVARRLLADGAPRRRAYEVVAFCDEEGRFSPYVGSRAMTGSLDYARVPRMRDVKGTMLTEALHAAGLDAERLPDAARPADDVAAYLELHIEQGPVLERQDRNIGVVTGIVGQVRLSIKFHGRPDHAGTTPMDCRRDAFAAAAAYATDLRRQVLEQGGGIAVMTVGIVEVQPGAGNVVPALARLGLEIRDLDQDRLSRLAALAESAALASGVAHDVTVEARRIYETTPAPLHAHLQRLIDATAAALGLSRLALPSGAGHDAQVLAPYVPSAMIFIPSKGGRSHCPEEETDWADIDNGVDVLYGTVAALLAADSIDTV